MPERWKQRRGSLQLTSVTITRLAPACQHCRTTSATNSGLVLAACSGVRSHAMFGLSTTTSWRLTNRLHSAEIFERLRHERARLGVLGHGHLRPLRRRSLRDDRAAPARPAPATGRRLCSLSQTARACRARGYAADAQQLQHGFAPRHLWRGRRSGRVLRICVCSGSPAPAMAVLLAIALDLKRWMRSGSFVPSLCCASAAVAI